MAKNKTSNVALVAKMRTRGGICTDMKRKNGLFEAIVSLENLKLADIKARAHKAKNYGIQLFDMNHEENILSLQRELESGDYRTGEYDIFKIFEPKEREIARLQYKHRVVHHAIMNVMEPIWTSIFTSNSYSCIKGKGIHKCLNDTRKALHDIEGTKYCLKIDVQKFYPSIDRQKLMEIVERKIKCKRTLALHREIINSAPGDVGVPIGNYLSQFYANLYLTYFDHWIKEIKKAKYYFRYCDDMVIFSSTKTDLHVLLGEIREYLSKELHLTVKKNYQVFPVAARGVDFVGYKMFHTHTLLRKSIKKSMIKKKNNPKSIASYGGWAVHCNCINLFRKTLKIELHDTFKRNTSKN